MSKAVALSLAAAGTLHDAQMLEFVACDDPRLGTHDIGN
jgi:hypothetical protein